MIGLFLWYKQFFDNMFITWCPLPEKLQIIDDCYEYQMPYLKRHNPTIRNPLEIGAIEYYTIKMKEVQMITMLRNIPIIIYRKYGWCPELKTVVMTKVIVSDSIGNVIR